MDLDELLDDISPPKQEQKSFTGNGLWGFSEEIKQVKAFEAKPAPQQFDDWGDDDFMPKKTEQPQKKEIMQPAKKVDEK